MKIGIVGGAGRVGSSAAFALELMGAARHLALVDVAQEVAAGEALDLLHASAGSAPVTFASGDYEALEGCEVVIITAGLRRKPDESRLDLINRNVSLFRTIMQNVLAQALAPDFLIFVVANPVDILTYLAATEFGLPSHRVLGLGTMLDTQRFRSLLAQEFGLDATQVKALVLGEHGDSMVPVWSQAQVNGMPLESLEGFNEERKKALEARTRGSGAEVIRLKGGAGYAVGVAIANVVKALNSDAGAILPVSALQQGALGISGVALSLPTRLKRKGVDAILEPKGLAREELEALRHSAEVLAETLAKLG